MVCPMRHRRSCTSVENLEFFVFFFEALLLYQLVQPILRVLREIDAFHLLIVLEAHELWLTSWNVIDLEPLVSVGLTRILHERLHLWQLVQLSATASLDFALQASVGDG